MRMADAAASPAGGHCDTGPCVVAGHHRTRDAFVLARCPGTREARLLCVRTSLPFELPSPAPPEPQTRAVGMAERRALDSRNRVHQRVLRSSMLSDGRKPDATKRS
ncbi:hypothetical protein HPB50_024620 [Hyalomma asiaticum]|uniref:Uncharacterized protein n=1 Tax=Hyalomma asiaticum TaxID=266040 RepID=A0ACB7SL47_HYAAI|nr:hypothetical protein HPB50_024620 [Hyalomma asiaticum]